MTNTEHAHSINGVEGRMYARFVRDATKGTFSTQTWKASREYNAGGDRLRMTVKLRFDDQCGNGHNTFAATCGIDRYERGQFRGWGGGADHEAMVRVFPELAPLLKWHLVSTDGPTHYLANTLYQGKVRELDHARSTAVWPEATDEELMADDLRERLVARLPALMADFRAAIESCGFAWVP